MSHEVWKFRLEIVDHQRIVMPEGARILSLQMQGHPSGLRAAPCMWALVNPNAPEIDRHFRVYGTGHPISTPPGTFVGTFQIDSGALVFHVFEAGSST